MRSKLRVFVCAALCVALGVGTAWAGVTINGKALSQIDDIILETGGSRTVKQESLLKVFKSNDGDFRIIAVKGDGTGSIGQSETLNLKVAGERTNTGAHPAVGTKRNDDGSFYLLVPSASDHGVKASLYRIGIDENCNITQTQLWGGSSRSVDGGDVYVNDAAGGLSGINGREVFVIAYFTSDDHKRPGLGTNYTAWLAFVDTNGTVWKQRVGKMVSHFPSVRVAVGDFDNDGTNDLAVIRDGSKMDYYMQVFGVDSELNISEKYHKSIGTRDPDANNIDACDVVAGDFNGDGHTDLAAIYSSVTTDEKHDLKDDGCPTVTTFRWNGSGFSTSTAVETNRKLRTGSDNWLRWNATYVPHFGLIAEAGDLDGNGKDELVFLTPSYNDEEGFLGDGGIVLVSVWGADNDGLTPSRITWKDTGVPIFGHGGVGWTDMAECSYLQRSVSLALVPIGDRLNTGASTRRVFFSRSQGDDDVQKAYGYTAGDTVFYMTPKLSDSSLTGLSDAVEYNPGSKGRMLGLVHADFYCQSVELGKPDHLVYAAERSYVAEIQTPPYHVDYVQAPFEVNGKVPTAKSVLNMTFMGSSTAYSKSDTDSSKQDVTFKPTSTLDWGMNTNASTMVKLVSGNLSGGYKDTSAKVEKATSASEAKTNLNFTSQTNVADVPMMYKTDRHVWRYPVLSAPDSQAGKPYGGNGKCFMTFSLFDSPTLAAGSMHASSQFDDYNPIHEEGNLFSYPTTLAGIPYYGTEGQVNLTAERHATTGGDTRLELRVSESGADSNGTTTTSKKVANGSASVSIGIPKLSAGTGSTAAYSRELTNTETFTKSYLTSETFAIQLHNNQVGIDDKNIAHLIRTQLYTDVAGIMKVGFAVDLQNSNAVAWMNNGMYGSKPDPALVLPSRFVRSTSVDGNVTGVVWNATDDRITALKIRGIWFRDGGGDVVSSALVKGKTYTIEIPVYNASFRAPDGPVTAEMRLRHVAGTEEDDEDLGLLDTQTFTIGGWKKDTKDNKATVKFKWTVDREAGYYDLYFVLDPEKNIPELHEKWDYDKDPGGNNVGFYPIAVLEKEPEVYTAGTASIASASESDFKLLFRPADKDDSREWLTFDEFRAELANTDDDFRAHAKIVYSGSETPANLYLDVFRLDPDGTEARVATRFIPALFPNTEKEVSFMVSPEKMKSGKFSASLAGHGVNLHWGNGGGDNSSSGSSGCDAGWASVALLALPCAFLSFLKKETCFSGRTRTRR